jgi:hypothetical protein
MSCVKVFVHEVCDMCVDVDVRDTYVEWLIGYLTRGMYKVSVDDESYYDVVVYEVCGGRYPFHDVFDFVAREGWHIVYATYLIGAYVEVSVCDMDEVNCVNLYLNDIRKVERDELPIVGV